MIQMRLIDIFFQIFDRVCDKHAPLQSRHIKDKRSKNPWITPTIKKLIKKKHVLFLKVLKSNYNTDIFNEYKKHRNYLTNVMRNSKRKYYSDIFYKDRDSPKKTWEHINELLNKSQRNGDCRISELKINKEEDCVETVTSPADISNAFNDFFLLT